jgi:type VI protein secretion system component Hcp
MAVNAVMRVKGAKGEARGKATVEGKPVAGWIELQGWDWEVEADTSWTRGGGASVGKPNPGKMTWEHYFDSSSTTILTFIWSGRSFDEIELAMFKGTGTGQEWFFRMEMKDSFITKVTNNATEDGNVIQKVEMVFKEVVFHYKPQNDVGKLATALTCSWDIPAGKVG